jgi:drug/metabolite transporter (DMT)-like permease
MTARQASLRKSLIFASLATLAWSTVAAVFKMTIEAFGGDIGLMLFYSTLFSFFILGAAAWKSPGRAGLLRPGKAQILGSALLGFFNPFAYYLILFKAYSLLPGQEAQPLNFTWPIVLALLSVPLLGQRLKPLHGLAILLSFTGVFVIGTRGLVLSLRFSCLPGVVLAAGSSLLWALYWILNVKDRRPAVVKLFTGFAFGLIYIFLYNIFLGQIRIPSLAQALGALWIGTFEMGLTFLFWMKALELAPETVLVSNLVYLAPFLSLLFLNRIAGERILPSSVLGLCLIVAGLLVQSLSRARSKTLLS